MSFFGKKNKDTLQFKNISGIPLDKGSIIAIKKEELGILITAPIQKYEIRLDYNQIISITGYNYKEEISKNKSVIGRAVLGGILTGGIGAVVGGMSGIGSKKKSKSIPAFEIQYCDLDGQRASIILEDFILIGTSKFMQSINEKACHTNNTPEIAKTLSNETDVVSQLEKLSNLKKSGVISSEEFEKAKSKILK